MCEALATLAKNFPPCPAGQIHTALPALRKDIRGIAKTHTQKDGAVFNYRSIEDALNILGPALAEYGISVMPYVVHHSISTRVNDRGKLVVHVTVQMFFVWYHEDGSYVTSGSAGEAMAWNSDKATPKAQSIAFREALFLGLQLPVEEGAMEDPDGFIPDQNDTYQQPQQPQRPQQQRPPAQQQQRPQQPQQQQRPQQPQRPQRPQQQQRQRHQPPAGEVGPIEIANDPGDPLTEGQHKALWAIAANEWVGKTQGEADRFVQHLMSKLLVRFSQCNPEQLDKESLTKREGMFLIDFMKEHKDDCGRLLESFSTSNAFVDEDIPF